MKYPAQSIFVKDTAKRLMTELGVCVPYILDFENNNQIYLFKNYEGYKISPGTELFNRIQEIERECNVKVYAVTSDIIPIVGLNYTFLCVSPYPEDWDGLLRQIDNDLFRAYAYVHNVAVPECSESGFVSLSTFGGGVKRVG